MSAHPPCTDLKLRPDIVMNLASYGVGATLLLAFFHDKLDLPGVWLQRLDILLALCVLTFFMRLALLVFILREELRPRPSETEPGPGMFKRLASFTLLLAVMVLGVKLAAIAEASSLKSALVLGLALIAASLELFVRGFRHAISMPVNT